MGWWQWEEQVNGDCGLLVMVANTGLYWQVVGWVCIQSRWDWKDPHESGRGGCCGGLGW